MADKQATVFVIDLGSTTGDCHNGRIVTDLEYGMQYVWDKIAEIMSANRKTWTVGILGFRTDETHNDYANDGYDNISVLKDLGPMDFTCLEDLRPKIVSNETEAGDAISAIIIAIEMIHKYTTLKTRKPAKVTRKIILLTDGQGNIEDDNIEPIVERLNDLGIELTVIGIDFDDAEYGFMEEDKSDLKRHNEQLLMKLTESCQNGTFGTAAAAIEYLAKPTVRVPKAFKQYEGRLGLGDYTAYPDSAMFIDVQRYFKTKIAKAPSASSFVSRTSTVNKDGSAESSNTVQGDTEMTDAPDLSVVKSSRTYHVVDPSAQGGKLDVERDQLAKGYYYGSTAVPFGEDDEIVTRFESLESFSIIGFIPSNKYERFLNMGESCVTIAQPVNDKARMAMSSLVRALQEQDSYAVATIVPKAGKDPVIIMMAPWIKPDLECLIDVPMPFAEDVRIYRFPPLDKVIGSSGSVLTKHRYLPTEEQDEAMSDYVDSMDLSTFGRDDEGNPTEYMPIEETFSPMVHRVQQAIRQRAIHPDGKVGEVAEALTKWNKPPSELVAKASPQLEKLMAVAAVTKVPPKKKGKRGDRETVKPLSGLDVNELLSGRKRKQDFAFNNAIPEFKQMLSHTGGSDEVVARAADQMGKAVCHFLKNNTGAAQQEHILELLRVFREEIVEIEMPSLYNDFLVDLKEKLLNNELGEGRDFWRLFKTKNQKLGLIDDSTKGSETSAEEAADFLKSKSKSM